MTIVDRYNSLRLAIARKELNTLVFPPKKSWRFWHTLRLLLSPQDWGRR